MPMVFDLNLESYEEYIITKCFETFKDEISKGAHLNKEEFLARIEKDKAFKNFIKHYVLIKEYWHAEKGTIIDVDFTIGVEDSLFKDYLIWGAQAGNAYGGLICAMNYQSDGEGLSDEILESIKHNKTYDFTCGGDEDLGFIQSMEATFKKYSLNDFESYSDKVKYLESKTSLEIEKANKKDPEKWTRSIRELDSKLPKGFYTQPYLDTYKRSARHSLYSNNYGKASRYINEMFKFLKIDPKEYINNINNININPYYYDVHNEICGSLGRIFLTDAYFNEDFLFEDELDNIRNIFKSCYANPDTARYKVEGAEMWFGLTAIWHEEYGDAYDLLLPSKLPKHLGGAYAKESDVIVPAFFNYAAIAALKKNYIDQAEEFLYHAEDAFIKYSSPNNFHSFLSDLIQSQIVLKKGKPFQASKLLLNIKNEIESGEYDLGYGYFIDEDIDIFISLFLDLSFELKKIDSKFFVDPLFLFELKNLVFQSENLLGLRKNKDESQYNGVLLQLDKLREKEITLENQILESTSSNTINLTIELEKVSREITSTRNDLFNLKTNLKNFYGISDAKYNVLQKNLDKDEVILFYNFSIGSSRAVVLSKQDIKLEKINGGRNQVRRLISNIRETINIESGKSASTIYEYDFKSSIALYNIIFKKLGLQKFETIYTFSNEILNSLPLQIIVSDFDEEKQGWEKYYSAKWLNQSYEFAILESLTKKQKPKNYKNKFVGIGDPDLSNNPYFEDLPQTKQELIDLAVSSGGSSKDLYMKKQVNLKNIKNLLESNSERIVIASHAFSSNSFPFTKESGIVLSGESQESSFISASEIAQLQIDSNWIVLSACDTGFPQNSYSKNYSSLAKSFLAAGVDSVLISNWNIETNTSARITKQLFNEVWLNEETTKHQALKASSEDLRKDLSKEYHVHPAFWGAYSIVYNSI